MNTTIKTNKWNLILVALPALFLTMPGCNDAMIDLLNIYLDRLEKDYAAAKQDAMGNVEVIRDFHSLYPEAIGFFTYYTGHMGDTRWTSKAWLYGRYELNLKLPIQLSADRRTVIDTGEPSFLLKEITRIEHIEGGVTLAYPGDSWRFGPKRWEELKQVEGRIEKVFTERAPDSPDATIPYDRRPFKGILLDEPVPLFDEYVADKRRDR